MSLIIVLGGVGCVTFTCYSPQVRRKNYRNVVFFCLLFLEYPILKVLKKISVNYFVFMV